MEAGRVRVAVDRSSTSQGQIQRDMAKRVRNILMPWRRSIGQFPINTCSFSAGILIGLACARATRHSPSSTTLTGASEDRDP
jgi:hypothetical protein